MTSLITPQHNYGLACLIFAGLASIYLYDPLALGDTIYFATPLLFAALAFAIPMEVRFYNIGAEGQMLAGGLVAAVCGYWLAEKVPAYLLLPICLVVAFGAGAFLALLSWFLKQFFNVNEVVSTLLLNFSVQALASYLVIKVFPSGSQLEIRTPQVADAARLPHLSQFLEWEWIVKSQLNAGTLLAAAIILLYGAYRAAQPSIAVRAVGFSQKVAEISGLPLWALGLGAAALGGGLAGLGSVNDVLGHRYAYLDNFAWGIGYSGIVAALLFRDSMLGILAACIFLGFLQYLNVVFQATLGLPKEWILVTQGALIIIVLMRRHKT